MVYALKQHQKLKVLEGHKEAISALAFNKEGSRIVSYCSKERMLRVWEVNFSSVDLSVDKRWNISVYGDIEQEHADTNRQI